MTDRADKGRSGRKRGQEKKLSGWRWLAAQIFAMIRQFGGTLIWAGVVAYGIYVAGNTFKAFAGQTSIANFVVELAAHVNITIAISVSVSGVASVMWYLEHKRHRKTRERLTSRISQLEKILDPNRQSSRLTTEGTTRVGDL